MRPKIIAFSIILFYIEKSRKKKRGNQGILVLLFPNDLIAQVPIICNSTVYIYKGTNLIAIESSGLKETLKIL